METQSPNPPNPQYPTTPYNPDDAVNVYRNHVQIQMCHLLDLVQLDITMTFLPIHRAHVKQAKEGHASKGYMNRQEFSLLLSAFERYKEQLSHKWAGTPEEGRIAQLAAYLNEARAIDLRATEKHKIQQHLFNSGGGTSNYIVKQKEKPGNEPTTV